MEWLPPKTIPATPLSAVVEWSEAGSGLPSSWPELTWVGPIAHSPARLQPLELSEKSSEKYTVPPLQTPAAQPQVPSLPHFLPQTPQLFGSLAVVASQALAPLPSQSDLPLGQRVQLLLVQY